MSDWTESDDTFLRDKWGNTNAADIGGAIGRTKNAVIGRAHRIGLEAIKRVSKRPRSQKPRREKRMHFKPEYKRIVPPSLFAPPSLAVSILDLGPLQCSYIEGDDRLCCGQPSVLGARWCAFHYRVVYRAIDNEQRSRSKLAAE